MPETYGIPEEEPTRPERAQQVAASIVAGQSPVRTVALYAIAGLLVITPAAPLAVIPLILLLASDLRLS